MRLTSKRILVAGIGNIFFADDAFGCEVARRLSQRELPSDVAVVDFGIRGFDLAIALLEDYELSILIDATPRGGAPGTLYVIEVDLNEVEIQRSSLDTHATNPLSVLALVKSMGHRAGRILIVGCEPSPISEHEDSGLSEPVAAMVAKAVELVESLITNNLNEGVLGNEGDRAAMRF